LLTISASLNLQWIDSNLVWDPVNFGNLKAVRLPIFNIWLPGKLITKINNIDFPNYLILFFFIDITVLNAADTDSLRLWNTNRIQFHTI
jgi:hypothetical protein